MNKGALSSNSFQAVGHLPDKFALSDPIEADTAVEKVEHFDSKLAVVTNVEDLATAEVIARYKEHADIERGFRSQASSSFSVEDGSIRQIGLLVSRRIRFLTCELVTAPAPEMHHNHIKRFK